MLAPNRSQAIPPIALPHVGVNSGKASQARLGSYVQKAINDQVNKAVLDAAMNNPSALYEQMQPTGWRGIFGGMKGSPAQQQAFNRLFNGVIGSDIVRDGKLTPQAQSYFKDSLPKTPTWLQQKMPGFFPTEQRKPSSQVMQGMRLMAGSYMLGGLSNLGSGQTWEEAPVSKGVGAVAGAASSGMMAGGAAAMMGLGPIGIAAAAAVPVVQELSKAIGEIASEKILGVASALQRANSAWEDIYEDFQKWDFSQFKEKIGGLDLNNLTGERASARTQYQSDKAEYDAFMSSWTSKMRKLDS